MELKGRWAINPNTYLHSNGCKKKKIEIRSYLDISKIGDITNILQTPLVGLEGGGGGRERHPESSKSISVL